MNEVRQRIPPLRDRALLDLAHQMRACTIGIPEVCIGYQEHGLEPAHGPKSWLGGGGAQKPDDVFAAACRNCHHELDAGKTLSRQDRQFYWARGAVRTWAELMRLGLLKLA